METLSGTWVNKKYDTMGRMGKLVFERNGTFLQYTKINGIIPYVSGVFSVEDVRIDATGNIRCKIIIEIPGDHTKYKLSKITDSGTTLVFSMSSIDYPGKLGPNYFHYKYRIYYRQ